MASHWQPTQTFVGGEPTYVSLLSPSIWDQNRQVEGKKFHQTKKKPRTREKLYSNPPHPHFWSQIDGRGLKMEETGRFHKT